MAKNGTFSKLEKAEIIAAFYGYSVSQYYRKISDGVEFLEPVSETETTRIFRGAISGGKIHHIALPRGTRRAPAVVTANTVCVTWHLRQPFGADVKMFDDRPGTLETICRGDYGRWSQL